MKKTSIFVLAFTFTINSFIYINSSTLTTDAECMRDTKINQLTSYPTTYGSYLSPVGNITWFDDNNGDNGQTLGPKDCATKGGVDNPIDGTEIWVFKGTNHLQYPDNDPGDLLYKEDVGSLPSAVLDIRLEEMSYFGVQAGRRFNGDAYGTFTGYYYHS